MKVKANRGMTINSGNYEFVRFEYGIEDEVRNDETVADALDRIDQIVVEMLDAQAKPFLGKRGKL